MSPTYKVKVFSSVSNISALSKEINEEINHRVHNPRDPQKAVDTALLIAIVSTASTSVVALITGVLNILKDKGTHKVTIEVEGRKIEFPSTIKPEQLAQYLQAIELSKVQRIEF